jgi:hypothetical protein
VTTDFLTPYKRLIDVRQALEKRIATELNPAIRQLRELETILRSFAAKNTLAVWLREQQQEYNTAQAEFEQEYAKLDIMESKIQPGTQSDREVLKAIDHAHALAEPNDRKIESHTAYL